MNDVETKGQDLIQELGRGLIHLYRSANSVVALCGVRKVGDKPKKLNTGMTPKHCQTCVVIYESDPYD